MSHRDLEFMDQFTQDVLVSRDILSLVDSTIWDPQDS